MQDSLTFLYDLVLGVGSTYVGLGFIIGVVNLWKKCDPDRVKTAEDAAATPIALPASTSAEVAAVALPKLESRAPEPELELEAVEVAEQTLPEQQRNL